MALPVVALGEGSPAEGSLSAGVSSVGEGSGASSSLEGGLVIAGSPDEGEQRKAQEEARRNSPEAVAGREESQTKYEGLSTEAQATVAGKADPRAIGSPGGGPPSLPSGQSIGTFSADNVATLSLPGGQHGVLESMAPMAVETSSGQRVPIDLALHDVGAAFEPSRPWEGVSLRIPKRLSDGVSLASGGVSLTPVDEQGVALGGSEGAVVGSTVFYGSTETDTAVAVKPTTFGFDLQTLLYSASSPQTLYFRVGLAEGVALRKSETPGEGVQVMDAGRVIATIAAPSAVDAEGTPVPVSMAITADMLTLTVDRTEGSYLYPIVVDPTVSDKHLALPGNWAFGTDSEDFVGYENQSTSEYPYPMVIGVGSNYKGGKYEAGQYGVIQYPTQHESRIYEFFAHTETFNGQINFEEDQIEASLSIANNKKEVENTGGKAVVLPNNKEVHETTLCVESGCGTGSVAEHHENYAQLEEHALANGEQGFAAQLTEASPSAFVAIAQEKGPAVNMDTIDKTFGSAPNGAYPGQWVNSGSGKVGAVPTDPGIGISGVSYSSPQASGWGHGFQAVPGCNGVQCDECWNFSSRCESGHSTSNEPLTYSLNGLPEGEDAVEVKVENATGEIATTTGKVLIDNVPPHNIVMTDLPPDNEFGESEYTLKAEATGSLAGIKSITVAVDGREVDQPSGSCSSSGCVEKGEWAINGNEFGVGEHKFQVTATDNAGNAAKEEIAFTVHHATPVSLGPGTVDPWSGEFALNVTDVSIAAPGSSLTVIRSYHSRHLTAGANGPLGPQWSLSVGGQESITKLSDGNVTLVGVNGGQTTFASGEGGKLTSPTGDKNLALSEVKNEHGELAEYVLADAANGTKTHFTSLAGPSGVLWKPTRQEGPLASETMRYIYQTVEGITEPKYALAPEPAGLSFSCISKLEKSEKLEKGCRALEFKYAEKTKESIGENEKEWGEYKGRLKQVLFEAYNPSSKKMEEPGMVVAEYAYDKQGRLRAEWNPRLEKPLKVVYGYDAEGHVTALTPPGQESWGFTYGAIAGDPSAGRLLKATQASASAGLWNGEPPKNTEAPKLSGSAYVGVRMAVSNGNWSNSPVAYGYQWEDCNGDSKECVPIAGATNANYTPTANDEGHTLVAEVFATNGGGTVIKASSSSKPVGFEITEYAAVGEGDPWGIALGPDGNVWFTMQEGGQIERITPSGAVSEYAGVEGARQPRSIVSGPDGNLWFSEYGKRNIGKMSTAGSLLDSYEVEASAQDYGITAGPDGNLWYVSYESGKVAKITTSGTYTAYALPSGSKPYDVAKGSDGNLWVTEEGTSKIAKVTTSGTITEYALPTGSDPKNIAAGPEKENALWFTEYGTNKIGKITTSGTITEYALPSETGPEGITAGPEGKLWFTEYTASKVASITTSGTVTTYALPSGSDPRDIAAGSENTLWFAEYGTKKIGKLSLTAAVGNLGAHNTQTIYYSAAANPKYPTCGEHPEWANMPCQTQPAEQPGTSGLPNLPVTTVKKYNIWDEPETTEETVGSTTRIKTATYDSAGRLRTSAISSAVGTATPTVTNEYNEKTGVLEKQCANEGKSCTEGKPKTITSLYNTLGQLTSYTDADEATTTYEYEGEGSYKGENEQGDRLRRVNDGKGTETYTYNAITGLLTELVNEYGTTKLTFTATYDAEGNMLTEGYPNGMTATYTYNQVDKPTGLVYKKTSNCTEEEKAKCKWFEDAVVPSIHGQWLEQTSTLSHQAYTYDAAGRLTQVQNTPAGGKCTTRIYTYEADTNRTSLATYEPNSKGECATETGTEEKHNYDTADRLIDSGVKYNEFGDITALPAADAGGKEASEELTSTYYTDNQLASQTQNGETIGYNLDPAGRTLETVATGKKASDVTNHYAGPGGAPSWTSNTSGETTRDIIGINGQLAAIQNNTEAPELQLADLHGDIIAKAYLSETATELASKADTSEFGVPTTSLPSKYSWLGALELPTELPSGAIDMGARSYIPQLGRFLQPDPIPGGSANAYAYTFGNPVNESDPSGEYTAGFDSAGGEVASGVGASLIAERKAAEEAAARVIAEEEAEKAAFWANFEHVASEELYSPEEWYEEEWYEEEGEWYEEAAYHPGAKGQGEARLESGTLYRLLEGKEGASEGSSLLGSAIPLCEAGSADSCARDAGLLEGYHGRGFRLACAFAAVAAFRCGGDEKFVSDATRESSYVTSYEARPTEEERPTDDPWQAIEDGDIPLE